MPPRRSERNVVEFERDPDYGYITELRVKNPAFTLWNSEGPIGAAGIVIFQRNKGEAWLRGSERMNAHPVACAMACRRGLNQLIKKHKLVRVQAMIAAGNCLALEFASWLGFEFEGIMRKAGPKNENYYMMARTK